MTTEEDMVRRALCDEAAAMEPPAWSTGRSRAVRGLVQRRRVRRAVLVAATALAVPVTAFAALLGGPGADRAAPGVIPLAPSGPPAASAPRSPAASASRSDEQSTGASWPTVRTVTENQRLDVGNGEWIALSPQEICEEGPQDVYQCSGTVTGNQVADSVSLRSAGTSQGDFLLPLYVGSGQAARMTVSVGAKTYRATVVTLPGHPGYAAGYVWIPGSPAATASGPTPVVTVLDASGAVLARLRQPG